MSLKPLITVYQEIAQPSATPVTPILATVVVGPAYDVRDYPDDAADILLTDTYGRLESGNDYSPPSTGTDAVTVLDGAYPAQSAGARVDHASVAVTLKTPRVILGSTSLGGGVAPVLGTGVTTSTSDRSLVTFNSPTANLLQAGVQPGDRVVLTSTTGQEFVGTVASVGEPNAAGLVPSGNESLLRLTAQLPAANVAATGSITIPPGGGAALIDGETFTLNDGVNAATVFEFNSGGGVTGAHVAVAFTGGDSQATVRTAAIAAINGVGGGLRITASPHTTAGVISLVNDVPGEAGNQTVSDTVADGAFTHTGMAGGTSSSTQWAYDATGECRVERVLSTQRLSDPSRTFLVFPEPGSDKLTVRGGISVPVSITPARSVSAPSPSASTVQRTLSYAELYLSYVALRQDLQNLGTAVPSDEQTVNGLPVIRGVGKIDARNPLAVGLKLALNNGGNVPIRYYGVSSQDSTGYANARARLAARNDLYCFVNLTQDLNVHAAFKTAFVQQASPTYSRDKGVRQRFRIALGSIPMPTEQTVYEGSISAVSSVVGSAQTGKFRTLSIAAASTGSAPGTGAAEDIDFTQILPGDTVTIGLSADATSAWQNRRGTHRVGHVNSSQDFPNTADPAALELVPGSSRWDDTAGASADDIEVLVRAPDGTVKFSSTAASEVSTGGGGTLGTILYSMLLPTVVGGPYTVRYVASGSANHTVVVTLAGFAITVTAGSLATHTEVAAAVNAHPGVSAILTATVTAGGAQVMVPASQDPAAPAAIVPGSGVCTATVALNDALFNQLDDDSATFLQAGVKAGDLVEIPLDPNNYDPTAYSGRMLTYRVGSVQNENRLRIFNGVDDGADAAEELPHYFNRDLPGRYLDNTAPNAINYRVRRTLTSLDRALALIAIAQSVRSARLTLMWPDLVGVSELADGGLARSIASVRTLAGLVPSYYLACAVGGVIAGTPAQMGLTGGSFIGFDRLANTTDVFSEEELSLISDGGYFLCTQEVEGALPQCEHQLTTDPSALETGELSMVKNIDYLSINYSELLRGFLRQYNNIPEALGEIYRSVVDNTNLLKGQYIAKIGAPLLEGTITSLAQSEFAADTVELFFDAKIAVPLNNIGFHLVVRK